MPVGGGFQRIPGDQHRARLLFAIEAQEHIRKAEDGAGGLAAAPQDGFRQSMIGAVCEGITIDDQQRSAGHKRRAMGAFPSFRSGSRL